MSEHERIFLEPAPGADEDYGRQWCQHNVWTDGVEYVRADTVSAITAERDRLREALIASRNAHAELAEFLLGDGGSAVKSDVLKGMFADLQRARLAADAALEPRS
jgi:hypothetical protein